MDTDYESIDYESMEHRSREDSVNEFLNVLADVTLSNRHKQLDRESSPITPEDSETAEAALLAFDRALRHLRRTLRRLDGIPAFEAVEDARSVLRVDVDRASRSFRQLRFEWAQTDPHREDG